MDERRSGEDRRKVGRPRGGRRVTDPILDLATHPHSLISPAQLADYWGVHVYTIHGHIRKGRLGATIIGSGYRIRVADAMQFERTDPAWLKRSKTEDTISDN